MADEEIKKEIQSFWGSLYQSLYEDIDSKLEKNTLIQLVAELEDMFRYRQHMAVVEMDLSQLKGKRVLEIGSGAGGHSALFASHGARVTSLDLTEDRVISTNKKLRLLEPVEPCSALQGDAETLPFGDESFDVVYSNGVLHHTEDTQKTIDEVFRVLKTDGKAVILLYCKSSWHYWVNLFLCHGILLGKAFRDKRWVGKVTEWGGKKEQDVLNPITKCYYASEIRTMFRKFQNVSFRKGEFYFYLIPKFGRIYRKFQLKRYGTHPGGLLVYGEPWPIQSKLELRLGKIMGFGWYISAYKSLRSQDEEVIAQRN